MGWLQDFGNAIGDVATNIFQGLEKGFTTVTSGVTQILSSDGVKAAAPSIVGALAGTGVGTSSGMPTADQILAAVSPTTKPGSGTAPSAAPVPVESGWSKFKGWFMGSTPNTDGSKKKWYQTGWFMILCGFFFIGLIAVCYFFWWKKGGRRGKRW